MYGQIAVYGIMVKNYSTFCKILITVLKKLARELFQLTDAQGKDSTLINIMSLIINH